jgi:hypothetical protein
MQPTNPQLLFIRSTWMKHMDDSISHKVGYAIVKEEHTIRKRILPQNTVVRAEQLEKNNRPKIVIIMNSLSTIMRAESRKPTKNSKTRTTRKMLDNIGPRITLATKKYQVTKRSTTQRKKR